MPDLPASPQNVEGFGYLLRLHEGVRAVEQQEVHIVGFQPAEAPLHRAEDVLLGKVVDAVVNGALGLDEHLFPHRRAHAHGLGKDLLRTAAAVNVRVVKEIDALVQRGPHQVLRRLGLQAADAHAAQGNLRSGNSPAQQNLFHAVLLNRLSGKYKIPADESGDFSCDAGRLKNNSTLPSYSDINPLLSRWVTAHIPRAPFVRPRPGGLHPAYGA